MAEIKKTLLKKQIAGQVVGLYPQTSADIVMYGESSTVADELAKLIAKMGDGEGSVSEEIKAAVEQAKKDLLGLDETNTQINEAYDTLREVAEWIESDTTGAAKIAKDVADVTKIVNGDPADDEDTGLVGAVAGLKDELDAEETGVKARLTAAEADIDAVEQVLNGDPEDENDTGLVGKVNSLVVGSTQIQVVASDFNDDDMNENDLYFVELPAKGTEPEEKVPEVPAE